jgi:PPOX class probable F420-dependent enzyme
MTAAPDPRLLAVVADLRRGVLTTIKRDGRPQLSTVAYAYDRGRQVLRISVTEDRAKTRNLRRDPRASFYIAPPDLWAYVVAEGLAELTPAAGSPDDATVDELVDVYRRIQGEHPDWEEFRAAMVDERRLVLRLPIERLYGFAPGS